jgi:hypothetical protein
MRILDKNNNEIQNPDLEKGYLTIDTIVIAHHEATEASPGKSHIEVLREYPNGGRDVVTVWDEKPVEAKAAYDEKETIQRYIPYTADELAEQQKQEEEQKKAELTPTNSDLSDAMVDLAQSVSDNGDGLADLGALVSELETRISNLEGAK